MLPETLGCRLGTAAAPPIGAEGRLLDAFLPVFNEVFGEKYGASCTTIELPRSEQLLGRQRDHWPLEQQRQQDAASMVCRHRRLRDWIPSCDGRGALRTALTASPFVPARGVRGVPCHRGAAASISARRLLGPDLWRILAAYLHAGVQ